jgi:hypothetical protein
MIKTWTKSICLSLSIFFACAAHSQDFYVEEHNPDFFNSSTLFYGQQWRFNAPNFSMLNFNVIDINGAYDMIGALHQDSLQFLNRSHYIGFGFNLNNIQCLFTFGNTFTKPYNYYNAGFGMGFNQVLHFSYKTGRPLIWFEGLINYNFLKSNLRFKDRKSVV